MGIHIIIARLVERCRANVEVMGLPVVVLDANLRQPFYSAVLPMGSSTSCKSHEVSSVWVGHEVVSHEVSSYDLIKYIRRVFGSSSVMIGCYSLF